MVPENDPPLHEQYLRKIKWKYGGVMVSESDTKDYNFDSLKHGYHSVIDNFIIYLLLININRYV